MASLRMSTSSTSSRYDDGNNGRNGNSDGGGGDGVGVGGGGPPPPAPRRYGSQTRSTRTRSDSIPEHRPIVSTTIISDTSNDDADSELESLLMRHSSPLAVVIRPGSAGRMTMDGDTDPDDATTDRHHFPVLVRRNSNSSPSPLRLNRPRSNPRNRTPMRYDETSEGGRERNNINHRRQNQDRNNAVVDDDGFDGLDDDSDRNNQSLIETLLARHDDEVAHRRRNNHEAHQRHHRITIRPTFAGAAVGAHLAAGNRFRSHGAAGDHNRRSALISTEQTKSRKQGPGRAKTRRTKNGDFVNLAREVHCSGSLKAAEALLLGHAHASKHRSLLDTDNHRSAAIERFYNDGGVRKERFFDGELPKHPYELSNRKSITVRAPKSPSSLTPLERFHRIEPRLRNILVKACVNSFAASKVVHALQGFLIFESYKCGDKKMKKAWSYEDGMTNEKWAEMGLLEAPTVAEVAQGRNEMNSDGHFDRDYRDEDDTPKNPALITHFLFDSELSTGGFHRLLLQAVCQFHGLKTVLSTMKVKISDEAGRAVMKEARSLKATGIFYGDQMNCTLVDFIVAQQDGSSTAVTAATVVSSKNANSGTEHDSSTCKSVDYAECPIAAQLL